MLLDIFSSSNVVSYNIKLAQLFGLNEAVYLGQLLDINKKAIKKGALEENFLVIDRKYIEERTTITEDQQNKIDEKFMQIGLLQKRNTNSVSIDLNRLLSIICCEDNFVIEDLGNVFKKAKKKVTKSQSIIDNLKSNIHTTNEELKSAYEEWIETIYAKHGWMSKKAVVLAQDEIDKFTNFNLDMALQIIDIATVNGYRDMTWAINAYAKNYHVNYTYTTVPECARLTPVSRSSVSEEVF